MNYFILVDIYKNSKHSSMENFSELNIAGWVGWLWCKLGIKYSEKPVLYLTNLIYFWRLKIGQQYKKLELVCKSFARAEYLTRTILVIYQRTVFWQNRPNNFFEDFRACSDMGPGIHGKIRAREFFQCHYEKTQIFGLSWLSVWMIFTWQKHIDLNIPFSVWSLLREPQKGSKIVEW